MKKAIISIIILIPFFSCASDKLKDENLTCDKDILISNELYSNSPDDPLIITDVKLENDCLQITFGSSCCTSENWIVDLVGAADVLYSEPPQRLIRLSLKNYELCQAVCGKTLIFKIKPTQVYGGEIILNLDRWGTPIRYRY